MISPSECFEDSFELDVEVLRAVPLVAGGPGRTSYPYPLLERSGTRQRQVFRSLVLENSYARITLLPDLGGRIASWFDKRSESELLDPSFGFEEGGARGVLLRQGIAWQPTGADRLNALGPVDDLLVETDESGAAHLILHELTAGQALSWHLFLTLPPDRAELLGEWRLFNRGDDALAIDPQIEIAPAPIAIRMAEESPREIGPHQLETVGFRLVPHPGVELSAIDDLGVLELGSTLKFRATEPLTGAKIILRTGDGRVLEAPADLMPERLFIAEVAELDVKGVVILDADRNERFRYEGPSRSIRMSPPSPIEAATRLREARRRREDDPAAAQTLRTDAGRKSWSFFVRAQAASEPEAALSHLEDALNHNAEDHLAWWLRGALRRHEEDRPELINAHFLAPLEPLLRAESFLGQNLQTKEASPLIAPMARNPDALVEVACQLFDAGRDEDLARWVDEGLRHREVPMLRYLLALAFLERSRMAAEAADHIRRAAQTPINPPYPWRETEIYVLTRLARAFPDDGRVADLLSLALWAHPE